MSRICQKIVFAVFCSLITLLALLFVFLPKNGFSETENRYLASFPTFSLASVLDGSFMKDFETYLADQFPARDTWVSTKARLAKLQGKMENNDVYFGKKDTLLARFPEPDEQLTTNLSQVQALANKTDIPVCFSLIPTATAIWSDRLPDNAPNYDQSILLDTAKNTVTSAKWIDIAASLTTNRDEDLYYRLDHHWTTRGAYYGYAAICSALGLTPRLLDSYTPTTVTDHFQGTLFSSSGVRWLPDDTIETYVNAQGVSVTSYPNGTPEVGKLYHTEKLDTKDKYSFFLGGNQPLCVIKNPAISGPKIMVIRDSYSDSLAPFLSETFSQVHLFDPRYNLQSPSDYAENNDIDMILVLYSTANFASDTNMFVLAR